MKSRLEPREVGAAEGFTVIDVAYRGLNAPEHAHDWDSLHLVLEGDVEDVYDGRRRRGGPGTLLVYRAGVRHRTRVAAGTRIVHLPYSAGPLPGDRTCTAGALPIDSRALTHALGLYATTCPTGAARRGVNDELLESLDRLGRVPRDPRAERVTELVRDGASATSLARLADRVGLSRSQLARTYRQSYGCSVGDMLQRIRVNRALIATLAGRQPLSVVALHAGFSDQSHMGRAFKRAVGVSPARLRRSVVQGYGADPTRTHHA